MIDPVDRAVRAIVRRNSFALITDATRELIAGDEFEFEERPSVELKGKQVQVKLWAPKSRDGDALDASDSSEPERATAGSGRD